MHRHHIVPKHAGGDDSRENLTPPISLRLHAAFHWDRWKHVGDRRDRIAALALLGRITPEAARLEAAKVGQAKSDAYKNRDMRKARSCIQKETLKRGGRTAAPALVRWQQANRSAFIERCRALGKARAGSSWPAARRLKPTYRHTAETKARISATMKKRRSQQA